VKRRIGHGFTDLAATRHMYEQFAATAQDFAAHVIAADVPPSDSAELIQHGVAEGRFRYSRNS
jgi:hypothetical protein